MQASLSFEQAPPISVPYRFFLTAPWFGVATGLLLAWFGESALESRWMPQTLGLVHLITAGFMLQAMCGALLQFVPVAAGGNVPRPLLLAQLVHPGLVVATASLVGAFLTAETHLYLLALPLFGLSGGFFIAAVARALTRITVVSPTLTALRLALFSLCITLALGLLLAWALAVDKALPMLELTDSHAAFGLGGWALVLLLGVSAYVVPMFQLTPAFPPGFTRGMARSAVGIVLIAPLALLWPESGFGSAAAAFLVFLGAAFGGMIWYLQQRRRRKVTDPNFWFFRGATLSVLVAAVMVCLKPFADDDLAVRLWFATGVLILGAFVAVINGMLYKIIPFINWLHLQRLLLERSNPDLPAPSMRQMIPEAAMQGQMQAYVIALALTFLAVWLPRLAHVAGVALAVAFLWLAYNLSYAMRQYRLFSARILLS